MSQKILAYQKRKKLAANRNFRFTSTSRFCRDFCQKGECKRRGCPFTHDPEKISICRAKCKTIDCPLSHTISVDRMPDCAYFRRGRCTNQHCLYRHVNVNKDAKVCEEFIKGYYCAKGFNCCKPHLFECPAYVNTGKCPRGNKCFFAHLDKPKKPAEKKPSAATAEKPKAAIFKKVNPTSTPAPAEPKPAPVEVPASQPPEVFSPKSKMGILLIKRLKLCDSKVIRVLNKNDPVPDHPECDFISLSTDCATEVEEKENFEVKPATTSAPTVAVSSKRKFFIIDSDDEDYRNTHSPLSSEHHCRPQLKIMPDFLMTTTS